MCCVTYIESEAAAAERLRQEHEEERRRKIAQAEVERLALEQAQAAELKRAADAEVGHVCTTGGCDSWADVPVFCIPFVYTLTGGAEPIVEGEVEGGAVKDVLRQR